MPNWNKPGVDWHEIEQRVRAGEPCRAISRDLTSRGRPISHVAISRRANKRGWLQPVNAEPTSVPVNLPGRQTLSQRQAVLEALRNGATLQLAALSVGVTESTLRNWRREDLSFEAEVAKARGIELVGQVQNIRRAAEKGDWRAAAHLLAKAPETKAEWGENEARAPALNITLNIERAVDPKTIEGELAE